MLRIHSLCLCWRKLKKEGIKILDLIKGSKPFTIHLPECRRVGVIIVRWVPTRKRYFANGIFPLNQIVPILAHIMSTGILARHSHNGDGLFSSCRDGACPRPRPYTFF